MISNSHPTFRSINFAVPTAPSHGQQGTMSPRDSSSSSGTQFTFVTGNIQSEARSHAMKEHWKRRHQRNKEAKTYYQRKSSRTLPLRSKSRFNEDVSPPEDTSSSSGLLEVRDMDMVRNREKRPSIPAQLLCGVSYALSSSTPDPFQTCPVHLTSQHQKLLHHCAYEDSKPCCLWKFC